VLDRVFGSWSRAPHQFSKNGYAYYGTNLSQVFYAVEEDKAEEDAALVAAWKAETLKRLEKTNV
jgi:hypothetical protein